MKTVPFKAYKGFDKNLKCRDYQFRAGETFTLPTAAVICKNGFHFCYELEEVFQYYPNDGNNRFFEIEVLGAVAEEPYDKRKACSNIIKLVREVDLLSEEIDKKVDEFLALAKEYNEIILGGSLALILQDTIPKRKVKDLDVVCHRYFEFEGADVIGESMSVDNDALQVYVPSHGRLDYFIIPQVIYKTIEYKGKKIKVQSAAQIIEAKMKYFNKGIEKHKRDIISYLTYEPVVELSDIPF